MGQQGNDQCVPRRADKNRSTNQIQEELSDNDEGADDWVANPSKPIYPMQSKFYDVSLGSPLLVTPVTDNLTSAIGSQVIMSL
jgi:hypothetical protein